MRPVLTVAVRALFALALGAALLPGPASAQYAPRPRLGYASPPPREAVAIPGARVVPRSGILGVVSGGLSGTYVRIANDLATLFDTPDSQLRVLPIVSKGSLQNLSDLFNVTDVDVAITQSDVLAFLRQNNILTANNRSVAYLAKLYDEEVHILAGPGINSLADLAGKKVNFDTKGSGTALTAGVVFNTLGIKPEVTNDDQETALAKLRRGEISGLVYVAGKPARLFTEIPESAGLHLLPIPLNAALLDTYAPSQFGHGDYAGLVPDGTTVDTVAVGAVMAVYNWSPGTPQYARLALFTNELFDHLGTLQSPGHHPKWKDVSLAAQVPGWTRFPAAAQWLQRHAAAPTPVVAR